MKFSVTICRVMNTGEKNLDYSYPLKASKLTVLAPEKDFGVSVSRSIKTSVQCITVVKKVNKILGHIRNGMVNNVQNIIMSLYKSLMWLHLEYCVQYSISKRLLQN